LQKPVKVIHFLPEVYIYSTRTLNSQSNNFPKNWHWLLAREHLDIHMHQWKTTT